MASHWMWFPFPCACLCHLLFCENLSGAFARIHGVDFPHWFEDFLIPGFCRLLTVHLSSLTSQLIFLLSLCDVSGDQNFLIFNVTQITRLLILTRSLRLTTQWQYRLNIYFSAFCQSSVTFYTWHCLPDLHLRIPHPVGVVWIYPHFTDKKSKSPREVLCLWATKPSSHPGHRQRPAVWALDSWRPVWEGLGLGKPA